MATAVKLSPEIIHQEALVRNPSEALQRGLPDPQLSRIKEVLRSIGCSFIGIQKTYTHNPSDDLILFDCRERPRACLALPIRLFSENLIIKGETHRQLAVHLGMANLRWIMNRRVAIHVRREENL